MASTRFEGHERLAKVDPPSVIGDELVEEQAAKFWEACPLCERRCKQGKDTLALAHESLEDAPNR